VAVFRVERTRDYTVMSNHHLKNKDLSLKAKGLLSQMLSLPENWDYTLAGLSAINRESKDAIRSAVNELEKAGYIRRRQTDSAGQTVEAAKEYIRQHYAESDLSVEKLCAYLHLSSTYFSTLFKRETGTSFTAYVTTVRMEAAAEAIRGTEEKTYLIAQRCGYEDPNYFSYVFKRHFGVTPTKYRSEGK